MMKIFIALLCLSLAALAADVEKNEPAEPRASLDECTISFADMIATEIEFVNRTFGAIVNASSLDSIARVISAFANGTVPSDWSISGIPYVDACKAAIRAISAMSELYAVLVKFVVRRILPCSDLRFIDRVCFVGIALAAWSAVCSALLSVFSAVVLALLFFFRVAKAMISMVESMLRVLLIVPSVIFISGWLAGVAWIIGRNI